ncbi:MAG: GNAT family N-acetyltransferase [Gammaproteobacteria bacterium]|jgi:predicted N-acyltransferase
MRITSLSCIDEVSQESWNALTSLSNPFIRHEFLCSLEHAGCVVPETGWAPCHLVATEGNRLLGALPLYLKHHSWGEFVFDFAWAEAYERSSKAYYPKIINAVPYTPATGPRFLVGSSPDAARVKQALLEAARELVVERKASSLHCLFTTTDDSEFLASHDFLLRLGCQYHWQNQNYGDFDDFLGDFTADKRKKVKRERRRIQEAGIETLMLEGDEISPDLWEVFYRFYYGTVLRKSGYAPLSLEFFLSLGRAMPENVVLGLARHRGDYVAAALSLRGEDSLYGRYWGASNDFHSLHFELCYYTGIEYCIQHGLQRFEPGAQGEHKISRGFLPTPTYSNHWLADPIFQRAIGISLEREQEQMRYRIRELSSHAPYKTIHS